MKKALRFCSAGHQRLAIALVALLAGFSLEGFSQAAVARWALTTNGNPSVSPTILAYPVVGGPGIGAITYDATDGMKAGGFTDLSINYDDYYEFSVKPLPGHTLTITSIEFSHRTNLVPMSATAFYSVDGFAHGTSLGINELIGNSFTTTAYGPMSVFVDEDETFSVRVYGMDAPSAGQFFAVKDFVIRATTFQQPYAFTVTKTVDPEVLMEPGGAFNYSIKIVNTSDQLLHFTLDDSETGEVAGQTLVPTGIALLSYSKTYEDPGTYTNYLTVTARDDNGSVVETRYASATATVKQMFTIEKWITSADKLVEPGGDFEYNIRLTNYSGKELIVHLEDTEFPMDRDIVMGIGQGTAIGYRRNYTTVGKHINIATATATDPDGNSVTKTATATAEVLPIFTITKTVDATEKPEGSLFNYTVTIKNNSNVLLTFDLDDTYEPSLLRGHDIAAGVTETYTYSHSFQGIGEFINTATATATDPDGHQFTKMDDITVNTFGVLPDFTVGVTVDPAGRCMPGGEFNYQIKITNTGGEILDFSIYVTGAFSYSYGVENLGPGQKDYHNIHDTYDAPGVYEIKVGVIGQDAESNWIGKNASLSVEVSPLPEITAAELRASKVNCPVEPCTWEHPVTGDLAGGYEMCLDPTVEFYYLDLLSLSSTEPIAKDLAFPFTLDVNSVPDDYYDYWAAKGVVSGAPGWAGYMYRIITGEEPMFYVYHSGTDLKLIDCYLYVESAGAVMSPLRVSGDYPVGEYAFTGSIGSEAGCDSDPFTVNITFKQAAAIVVQPMSQVACPGESVNFSVLASGTDITYQWYRDGSLLPGETGSDLTVSPVTVLLAGDYQVVVISPCGNIESDIAHLGVQEVLVDPNPQQYSDPVTITAIIHNGAWLDAELSGVVFNIGMYNLPSVDLEVVGDDLVAVLEDFPLLEPYPGAGFLSPGINSVQATFRDNDELIYGCIPGTELEILPENARLAYDGVEFQATASATSSTATVQLIAVIKDWEDGWPGDIREACITFRIFDDGGGLVEQVKLPVNRLVMPGDISTGIVSYDFLADIGNADYKTYTIRIIADCYYVARRAVTLTVYKPVGDFITGGGHIITSDSDGTRAGEPDTHTNFGFHVKFNKKGTNLIGGMNVIYRRMIGGELQEFQIKSNAMQTLGVNMTDPDAKTAVFTAKANLTNLTTDISVEGNLQLYVTLTDRGEPGVDDAIGITLWRLNNKGKPTTLVYSSSWNGVRTRERYLEGGNLVVHSGFSIKIGEADEPVILDPASLEGLTDLQVYPNPSAGPVALRFLVGESGMTTIDVISSIGQVVQRAWDGYVKAGEYKTVEMEHTLAKGLYFIQMRTGSEIRTVRLVISSTF